MGLDQYLYIKRKNKTDYEPATGFCGGMFGLAPDLGGEEIGYWRKDHEVDSVVVEAAGGLNETDDYSLTKEMCKDIITELKVFKKIYKNHIKETKQILKYQTNAEDIQYYYEELVDSKWDYKNMCNSIKTFKRALKYFKCKDFNGMYYYRSY